MVSGLLNYQQLESVLSDMLFGSLLVAMLLIKEVHECCQGQMLHHLLLNLSTVVGYNIDAENCLLFLDEIQTTPQLLSKLRWFAEDLPSLPVIAAGSLLDFVLADHSFNMPVGRINYLHLEPLSFEEFY